MDGRHDVGRQEPRSRLYLGCDRYRVAQRRFLPRLQPLLSLPHRDPAKHDGRRRRGQGHHSRRKAHDHRRLRFQLHQRFPRPAGFDLGNLQIRADRRGQGHLRSRLGGRTGSHALLQRQLQQPACGCRPPGRPEIQQRFLPQHPGGALDPAVGTGRQSRSRRRCIWS